MVIAARLRRSDEIAMVRAEGVSLGDRFFGARMKAGAGDSLRLSVSSQRAVGSAVRRNRARRRVREALRLALQVHPNELPPVDLVVSVRRPALDAPPEALQAAARRVVAAIAGAVRP